jgi:hypothetical protein
MRHQACFALACAALVSSLCAGCADDTASGPWIPRTPGSDTVAESGGNGGASAASGLSYNHLQDDLYCSRFELPSAEMLAALGAARGSCEACQGHCANGVKDCGEAGVDLGGECETGAPVCQDTIPAGEGAIKTPVYFAGLDDNLFCSKGSASYVVQGVPQGELDAAMADEENVFVVFGLGNSRNRNLFTSRFQYYPSQQRMIVKTGGGTCVDCGCCKCAATMGDGWCGTEIYRDHSLDFVQDAVYTLRWDTTSGEICARKGEEPERCFEKKIQSSFAFNTYCLGSGCDTMHAKPTSGAAVSLVSFQCETAVDQAPPSCP